MGYDNCFSTMYLFNCKSVMLGLILKNMETKQLKDIKIEKRCYKIFLWILQMQIVIKYV